MLTLTAIWMVDEDHHEVCFVVLDRGGGGRDCGHGACHHANQMTDSDPLTLSDSENQMIGVESEISTGKTT